MHIRLPKHIHDIAYVVCVVICEFRTDYWQKCWCCNLRAD